mgnify:CR=1 FL=1
MAYRGLGSGPKGALHLHVPPNSGVGGGRVVLDSLQDLLSCAGPAVATMYSFHVPPSEEGGGRGTTPLPSGCESLAV